MTPHIHFLENKFKLALTEKPKMELYGWLSQSSFDGEESGWCLEGGEDAYYEALKKWHESLIEISNHELFEEILTMRKGYFECIELKEGDSFELPSNLEFEITKRKGKDFTRGHGVVGGFTANDLRKFIPKAILKLKIEVRSDMVNKRVDMGLEHLWDEYSTSIPEDAYGGAEEIAKEVAGKEIMYKSDFMEAGEFINTNLKAIISQLEEPNSNETQEDEIDYTLTRHTEHGEVGTVMSYKEENQQVLWDLLVEYEAIKDSGNRTVHELLKSYTINRKK